MSSPSNPPTPEPKVAAAIFWGLVAAGIALDQGTKWLIFGLVDMKPGPGATIIPGFFYFTPRLNSGMAWSMFASLGSAKPAILAVLNSVIAGFIIFYREKKAVVYTGRRVFDAAMGLVLAGAIGNLIDRVHQPHHVMDFIHFRFFGWDYPIFNVADIYIVFGVIIFLYWGWRIETQVPDGK